jgi:hypothetical protein
LTGYAERDRDREAVFRAEASESRAPPNLSALSVGLSPVVDPRNLVDLTPLSYIPGMRVVRYLGGWWSYHHDQQIDGHSALSYYK